MASLYELTQEFIELQDILEESGGELTPEVEQQLELNAANFKEKANNYLRVMANIDSDIAGIDSELKRLNALKKTKVNAVERLKVNLTNYLIASGTKSVDLGLFKLGLRRSESVDIFDMNQVPPEFTRIEVSANKVALKDYLREHPEVDWAQISVKENLQIR